ncbi:hypothetical protein G3N56_06180 [Desulfovibrio sulfodismutans]|uniref:Major capsid protein E n=1 Tax=Desulfolutivibrio sulfodismutans TaxID=63561 RepID=A0A7K3NJI3_9BACT|nr:major capsid protein [Desulfolutivibrio sulfodismutans]NDY56330.1 hypothetical protein [Desulfolutivibrio sulfodismutans]QLA11513.1 hypothetical protein GD606_04095 [Desulfolutivibrio sulfodismutans DSM 3696]
MLDIRGLFTKEAIVRYLMALPVLKTPVMDTIFATRPQHPLPMLGVDDVSVVANPLPVVRRGAPSISAVSESGNIAFYEPLPVSAHKSVTGADLLNLQMLRGDGLEAWAREKTDLLRRVCRLTTEALCALALTGTVEWPVQLEKGGWEVYKIEYGDPLSAIPGTLWDAGGVKLKAVFELLTAMQESIQDNGFGGQIVTWAGKAAYNALFAIAEASVTTAKMRVEITEKGIDVGGYLVERRSERNRNPQTGAMTPVVADDDVVMVALDAGHKLPYCALDDLDANLQPLPFFVKPIKKSDPSSYRLVGMSKPFPVPNVKGICRATVLS